MRISNLMLAAVVYLSLGAQSNLLAQSSTARFGSDNKRPTQGVFGQRTLGWPIQPRPQQFGGGGLQYGPSGNFIARGRPQGGMAFPASLQPPRSNVPYAPAVAPATQITLPAQPTPLPVTAEQTGVPMPPAEATPPPPATSEGEAGAAGLGEQATTPAATAPTYPAPQYGAPQSSPYQVLRPVAPSPASFTLSPALTERINRIAQRGGLGLRTPVSVYVSGGVTQLRGVVATAHDRDVLANVLSLEPGVQWIDNQLTVQSS